MTGSRARRARRLVAGVLLAGVMPAGAPALAAQAAGTAPSAPAAQAAAPRHTPADTRFMQGMLHHHAQAVAMAALVPARTTRADLRALAGRIDVSQVDEMELMRRWLRERGEAVPEVGGAHDAHAAHGGAARAMMPGMLTDGQMAALAGAAGAEFDRLFLAGMIQHHEGAIVMVRELFATPGAAQETATFSFAADVESDQRAEIARMKRLLAAQPR